MELTQKQTIKAVAGLVLLSVITQVLYTVLYRYAEGVPRQWLWGLEGLAFALLAAVAGSALVHAKQYALGFSAILVSAIFNLIQVGIGITQFGAFREASQNVDGLAPAAGGVFALSFFIYNAAKVLLGLAAIVFGSAMSKNGANGLGKLTIFLGLVAIVANTAALVFGRIPYVPGTAGVIATLMLALCIYKLQSEDYLG